MDKFKVGHGSERSWMWKPSSGQPSARWAGVLHDSEAWSPGLKRTVAVGAVNNLLFAAGGSALTYLQTVLAIRVLDPSQIGIFAMASAVAYTIEWISDFGVGDRLVREEHEDLQECFHSAVTLQCLLAFALWIVIMVSAPWLARFYRQPALRVLIIAMSYSAFAGLLRLPLSLFYREMNYVRQRLLTFIGKAAGFVVTVTMVYTGAGLWSLVFGSAAALLATAIPAWILSPLRPGWLLDPVHIRRLMNFSSPVWTSRLSYVLVQQGSILVLSAFLSVQDVGRFKCAETLATFVFYVEVVLGQTLFPAFCRIRNSKEALANAFSQASRISMFWIAGSSFGMYLFANDIVRFVLTSKWNGAELFIKAQGVAVLFGATIFGWESLLKAKNQTAPILHMSLLFAGVFTLVFAPMVYFWGPKGAAAGLVLLNIITLVGRMYWLDHVDVHISLVDISKRSVGSAIAAAAVVLAFQKIAFSKAMTNWFAFAVELLLFTGTYLVLFTAWEAKSIRAIKNVLFRTENWAEQPLASG